MAKLQLGGDYVMNVATEVKFMLLDWAYPLSVQAEPEQRGSVPRTHAQGSIMADPCTMVLKAAETAARWHAEQKSKGISGAPYINHLLEVASLVAQATGAKDPNLILAALLHDANRRSERDEIARRFGKDVAGL